MIEVWDYALQFLVLLVCGGYAAIRSVRTRDRGWLMLSFFFTCFSLGDLYWLLCVALKGTTPKISYISELSWYAGYLFLCLLLRELQKWSDQPRTRWAWLAPAFTVVACLFFLRWGDYFGNLITVLLMGRLGYLVLQGLLGETARSPVWQMYLLVGIFFINEYAMWFASCFWAGDTLFNPYFWFDGILTLLCVLMARAYGKAVAA